MTTQTEQVTDMGITYDVLESLTLAECEQQYPELAAYWKGLGRVRQLTVKRPRGRKVYMMYEHSSPVGGGLFYSKPFAI